MRLRDKNHNTPLMRKASVVWCGGLQTAPLPIPESARPQLMKWEDVERLGMVLTEEAPHMLNTLTSPSGLKIIADIDTVVMLVQQVRV